MFPYTTFIHAYAPASLGPDMTVTVVATPTAKTKRRDPLTTINMATSQAQARPASSANGKAGRKGTRSSARLSLNSQEKSEENSTGGKRKGELFYDHFPLP